MEWVLTVLRILNLEGHQIYDGIKSHNDFNNIFCPWLFRVAGRGLGGGEEAAKRVEVAMAPEVHLKLDVNETASVSPGDESPAGDTPEKYGLGWHHTSCQSGRIKNQNCHLWLKSWTLRFPTAQLLWPCISVCKQNSINPGEINSFNMSFILQRWQYYENNLI